MINANLIDRESHFPIGGLMVKIPVLPGVGEKLIVDGFKFRVDNIIYKLETNPMSSYKVLIYLEALEES